MSTTIEQAEDLRDLLASELEGLVDTVTLDGAGIKPQTFAAVLVPPPKISFTTFDERDTTYSLVVVAGPAARPLEAWRRIDAIIDRLAASEFNLAAAEPAQFDLAGAGSLPAYEITLNPF